MNVRPSTLLALLLTTTGITLAVGCEFIASVDRDLIPEPDAGVTTGTSASSGGAGPGGSGGTAGMGGSGGTAGMGGMAGMGGTGGCTTADMCPVGTTCLPAACDMGACGFMNAAASTPCTETMGNVCDGMGECVECLVTADCPIATDTCDTVQHKCIPVTCTDTMKNGMETDVDCGGPDCSDCADGKVCAVAGDCISGVCTALVCAVPTCPDGVKNGNETDVDCGGSCATKCADGKACGGPGDCESGVCTALVCQIPSCSDTVKNGTEGDTDCGATCPNQCDIGQTCGGNGDCKSNKCTAGLCAVSCTDGIKNQGESDIDCGGVNCGGCADDKTCVLDGDCTSDICDGGVCGLNGCTLATATDLTGMANPAIAFVSFMYTPKCFKVTAVGTTVTFNGDFVAHPLVGGKIVNAMEVPQGAPNPFNPVQSTGATKDYGPGLVIGRYGFYCDIHGTGGMNGAMFVVP